LTPALASPIVRLVLDVLNWAQVRLLAAAATAESEAGLLELAPGRTVRALAAAIRAPEEADDEADDVVGFRLCCPCRVRRLWQHVVELARRMAGSELAAPQAAEAIAAEGLSARAADGTAWPSADSRPPAPPALDETRAAFAPLDWDVVREAVPEDIAHLGLGVDTLDAFAVDARMRDVVRAMRRIDWQLGRLLRVFLDRRLYRLMRFPSAARYLTERLGLSARKARALVALERKTWENDTFGAAYRAGDLSWVRALTLLPIVTEATARAWVERAAEVPVRRLADEVEWALTVRDGLTPIAPPPSGASLEIDERQMCARPDWLRPPARLTGRRSRGAPSAREGGVGGPAAPPRSRLRARPLAVSGARLHRTTEPPRPSSRLPLPRRE
jgi:hypothetical protein